MTTTTDIKSAAKDRLLGLLRKPAQAQKEKRPHNKLWMASLGFNGVMFFLDLVSAVTVAVLTTPLYGVLTFLAGFLALILHENLFTNAHAGMSQKWIAIGGGLLAIVSTIGIGVLAGIVNIFNLSALIPTQTIQIGMIIGLVLTAGTHGILWGVYYFTDEGHKSAMKAMINAAFRDQQRTEIENAKKDVKAVKEINDEIEGMGDDAYLLAEAFRENTGRELVTPTAPTETDTPIGDYIFARKDADARLENFRAPKSDL
jgi:hypothetical protein